MSKSFNSQVEELAIDYYLKSFKLDFEKRLSPLSSSSSDKENEDSVPRICRCCRQRRDYRILENRRLLERKKKQDNAKESNEPISDEENAEPSEFEPSATEWEPSDENPSDSEFEVETKLRRLNTSKPPCTKCDCNSITTPSILTPSNKDNVKGRRRNARKQASPKQFISPDKDEDIVYVTLPKIQPAPVSQNIIGTTILQIMPNGKRVHILPNSTKPIPPKNQKTDQPNNAIPKNSSKSVRRKNTKRVLHSKGKRATRNNTKTVPRNKTKPVPRNNTKPEPLERTKQIPNNCTKSNRSKQVTSDKTEKEESDQNQIPSTDKKTAFTETNGNDDQCKQKYQSTTTDAPEKNADIARKIKRENNDTSKKAEDIETPANNNDISNTLEKDSKARTEHITDQPKAENQKAVNKHVKNNKKKTLKVKSIKNKQIKKKSKKINVIINFDKFLKFQSAVQNMYKTYDSTLNLLPMRKQKELGRKKPQKFYMSHWVKTAEKFSKKKTLKNKKISHKKEKQVNITEQKENTIHTKENITVEKEMPVKSSNGAVGETYSDEHVDTEMLDEFDRSDDNILISNKFENINMTKDTTTTTNNNLIPIGSGKTLLPKDKFRKIKWNSYTVATRGLLLAAFPRRVLATHSMTGKRSPAFLNKPAKMCLDPKKVSDIIIEVSDRFKIRENLIRSVITTKCADESKMFKMRMQKREREAAAKEQDTKKKPTVEA